MKRNIILLLLCIGVMCVGCSNTSGYDNNPDSAMEHSVQNETTGVSGTTVDSVTENERTAPETVAIQEKEEVESMRIEAMKSIKNPMEHNPVMTQKYSADPYAMEYDGRVYLYMTGDEPMYEADGSLKTNNYSNIDTIRVISSADLVNWTDHGDVYAAGKKGAASWGGNSWAPAACWKMIDGKPKFFLYFANSGNGIAVLTADSPTGPFTDPIGEALVSRNTPTCAEVTWLFDPAVLVDDDGCGYLYFGGGVPSPDKASNPGTARVAKLADDMIHLDGNPVPIENVLYLFEDSGINKIGDKYIYSYCSNFNVPAGGCEGFGFGNGEIIIMEGTSPMGPFKTVGSILRNPEYFFQNGGNNHHCMFTFNGNWYVTYHASLIEEKLGRKTGYRSVNVDDITVNENGVFAVARGTKEGVKQIKNIDPYTEVPFVTMSNEAGISTVPADESTTKYGSGNMNLKVSDTGAFVQVAGVDFGTGASKVRVNAKAVSEGQIVLRTKYPNGEDVCTIQVSASAQMQTVEVELIATIEGVQDIFFVFDGEMELKDWMFVQ